MAVLPTDKPDIALEKLLIRAIKPSPLSLTVSVILPSRTREPMDIQDDQGEGAVSLADLASVHRHVVVVQVEQPHT